MSVDAADEALYNQDLTHQGVTFVASTGDHGTFDEEFPAFSPNVVAVGGTSLYLNSDDSYNSETGWNTDATGQGGDYFASGGGVSQYQAAPSFQTAVQSTGFRTIPDVSMVADPNTGAWISDTYNLGADNPWAIVGGTSLSAPTWAGLIALSNQGRVANGLATLNSSSPMETQQALYNLPEADFNDVTTGANGGFSAGAGYDLVTGLGTPVANQLVTDLAAYNGTVQSHRTVTVTDGVGSATNGGGFGTTNAFEIFAAEVVSPTSVGSAPGRGSASSAGNGGRTTAAGDEVFGANDFRSASAAAEASITPGGTVLAFSSNHALFRGFVCVHNGGESSSGGCIRCRPDSAGRCRRQVDAGKWSRQ